MKTDRAALFWGTVIAVAFVTVTIVLAFKFPDFRLPFTIRHGDTIITIAAVFLLLTASYRKLWKRPGFWGLLLVFLGAYWLIGVYVVEQFLGIRMDVLYGVIAGAEGAVFALIMARVYHRGPDISSFTGRRTNQPPRSLERR